MPLTIFYKPERRIEDRLTHWFLGCIDKLVKLEPGISEILFRKLGLNLTIDDETAFPVQTQVSIGQGKRIDGIIIGKNRIIGFENKVGDKHRAKQIYDYHKLLKQRYERKCQLLLTADRKVQSTSEIKMLIQRKRMSEKDFSIVLWQDMHRILRILRAQYTNNGIIQLLFGELTIVLEKMNMRSYSGISREEIIQYLNIKQELAALDDFITAFIRDNFDCFREKKGKEGSLTKKRLRFPFIHSQNDTSLFFRLYDDCFRIGFWCPGGDDLKKIERGFDYESLIEILKKLPGYEVYGLTPISDDAQDFDKIQMKANERDKQFELHSKLEISKGLELEQMESPDFRKRIKQEIELISKSKLLELTNELLIE